MHRSNDGIAIDVDKITPHEEFDPWSLKNDIAIIRTAKEIEFNDQIQSIPLPNENVADETPLIISGWGKNGDDSRPDLLQYIEVQTLERTECEKYYSSQNSIFDDDFGAFYIYSTNVCAIGKDKSRKTSTCPGDSGNIYMTN